MATTQFYKDNGKRVLVSSAGSLATFLSSDDASELEIGDEVFLSDKLGYQLIQEPKESPDSFKLLTEAYVSLTFAGFGQFKGDFTENTTYLLRDLIRKPATGTTYPAIAMVKVFSFVSTTYEEAVQQNFIVELLPATNYSTVSSIQDVPGLWEELNDKAPNAPIATTQEMQLGVDTGIHKMSPKLVKDAIQGLSLGAVCNLTATTEPSETDDSSLKYSPGSIWLDNTEGRPYICLTNTPGAAVWLNLRNVDTIPTDLSAFTVNGVQNHQLAVGDYDQFFTFPKTAFVPNKLYHTTAWRLLEYIYKKLKAAVLKPNPNSLDLLVMQDSDASYEIKTTSLGALKQHANELETVSYNGNQAISESVAKGSLVYVTNAAQITLPPVTVGFNFSIVVVGNHAVTIVPAVGDRLWLDGTQLAVDQTITNLPNSGDLAVLAYHTTDNWQVLTNGWSAV